MQAAAGGQVTNHCTTNNSRARYRRCQPCTVSLIAAALLIRNFEQFGGRQAGKRAGELILAADCFLARSKGVAARPVRGTPFRSYLADKGF